MTGMRSCSAAARAANLTGRAAHGGLEFALDEGKIVVDEWCVLVTHPSELLLNVLEIFVRHVIEVNKTGPRTFNTAQKFVQFQRDNSCCSVLGVLDEKDHQESDDRCALVLIKSCQVSE